MKRLFYCAAALATLLFAGSCQRENLEPVQENMPVTFTVEAPAAVQTKAEIGDGLNVNELIYEVWLTDELGELTTTGAQKLYQGTTTMQVDPTDNKNKATLTLDLMNDQKFTVLFWAQVQGTGVYNTTELNAVTYTKADLNGAYAANDERLAAFYAVAYVNDCQHVTKECIATGSQVTLYRPFAQLNLGTENTSTAYDVELSKSTMKITNVNTVFNVATSVASEPKVMTFVMNAVPSNPDVLKVNGKDYEYAGMNYLFAGNNAKVEYNIETLVGTEKTVATVNHTVDQVPLKENFRTNIIGNLLTNNVQYEIVVDADFNVPDIVLGEEWSQTGSYQYAVYPDAGETSLKEILEHADSEAKKGAVKSEGPVVTINLAGDVYWATGGGIGSTPLLPEDSPISAVVINGNGSTFTATGAGVGSIRLANGGKLTFNDVKIVDKSESYDEGSWELGYLEFEGNLEFNGCDIVNAIMVSADVADFKNTTLNSNSDGQYAVWVDNGTVNFINCSVKGARGIKVHECYSSVVTALTIDGCTFDNISLKPGLAIGDIWAPGANCKYGNSEWVKPADAPVAKITIENSYFFGCQPGDQGLYVYESDTDVTTFEFVNNNNEVHNTPSAMIEDWVDKAQSGEVVEIPAGEYVFPAAKLKEGVTLECAEGTVFTGASSLNINGATVIGATFSNPSGNAVSGTINGTIKDCVFEGSNGLRYCYAGETVVFENCVFSGSTYGAHFDGGSNDIIFKNCTFSGFNAFGSAVTLVTFDECTFKSNGKSGYNGANLWGSTKMINTEFIFDGTASTEWIDCISADKTYELTGCTINGGTVMNREYVRSRSDETDITIDGVLYENYMTQDFIATAAELVAFAEDVNVNKNSYNGKTVYLVADIDLEGIDWEPIGQTGVCTFNGVFDGMNHTISNLTVDSETETGANYSSGLFGWIEAHTWDRHHGVIRNLNVEGATINGHHNCAVIAGYLIGRVENCHVTGATITCTVANADANGDKAGTITGIVAEQNAYVEDCSATDVTIKAGRDAGQLVGCARNGWDQHVTGCSATNVTVEFVGEGENTNIRNEIVGRLN